MTQKPAQSNVLTHWASVRTCSAVRMASAIRRECLDQILTFYHRHFQATLHTYTEHNSHRGLIHEYQIAA